MAAAGVPDRAQSDLADELTVDVMERRERIGLAAAAVKAGSRPRTRAGPASAAVRALRRRVITPNVTSWECRRFRSGNSHTYTG
jgi:hypothetical protein